MDGSGRGGPRTFGTPGGFSRGMTRYGRLQWAAASWRTRVMLAAAAVAVFTIGAAGAGFHPLAGAAVGVAFVTVTVLALQVPEALKFTAAAVVPLPFLPLVAGLYAAAAAEAQGLGTLDLAGAGLSLLVSYLVALWVAGRWSRGRVWVTVLAVAGSTIVPGLLLVQVFPWAGLNAARVAMAAVLVLRCGGWQWLAGATGLAWDWVRARLGKTPDEGFAPEGRAARRNVLGAWGKRAEAERATAEVLAGLDDGFTVFHDLKVKGAWRPIGHVVVGPGGGFLLASVEADGPVAEDAAAGVTIPGVPLAEVAAELLAGRAALAKVARVPEQDLPMLVVVHGDTGGVEVERRRLDVYGAADPFPAGSLMLLPPSQVVGEVAPGFVVWGRMRCAQVVRRLRMVGVAAAMPDIRRVGAPGGVDALASVDAEGRSVRPSGAVPDFEGEEVPGWMVPGARCRAVTTLGNLHDLRVVSAPRRDGEGRWVVDVCTEEEWVLALDAVREPRPVPYPAVSIALPVARPTGQDTPG